MSTPEGNSLSPGTGVAESVWGLPERLTEISWFRDWDYYIAAFSSLKKYWHDYGTVPVWNFHFCGGRPELANPQNWTLTWLHPLIYVFEPVHLILLLWLVMTIVGSWATAALLYRSIKHKPSSMLAGLVYALSGYFGAHFNQGVVTFSFMHLIPLLILIADRRSDKPTIRNSIAMFSVSLAFFTSALPHGLFYFYPAFLLYLLVKMTANPLTTLSLRKLVLLTYPHLFGLGVALYKLFPVIAWQRLFPREGVLQEALTPAAMVANLLRIDANYDNMLAKAFDDQFWFLWEYNAFIGAVPIIAAVCGLSTAFRHHSRSTETVSKDLLLIRYGVLLIICGTLLSAGNTYWYTPGYWFKQLPLVGGIRVFGRFQILIIFGIVVLASIGCRDVLNKSARLNKYWHSSQAAVFAFVMALTILPLLFQTGLHISSIRGTPFQTLESFYQPSGAKILQLVLMDGNYLQTGNTHHDYLLRQNGIVANCYDPLKLQRPPAPFGHVAGSSTVNRWLPLSSPPPDKVTITANGLSMVGPVSSEDNSAVYLTRSVAPVEITRTTHADSTTTNIEATVPGSTQGLLVAVFFLVVFIMTEGMRACTSRK